MKSMRVMVTGGAGFVGSIVVEVLITRGFEVVVLDDLSTGHAGAIHPQARLLRGSVLDDAFVTESMAATRPEVIMHFAARSLVAESVEYPGPYLRDNYMGGITLAQRGLEHGVRRFVLSSTAAVYGVSGVMPLSEDSPCAPANPYGLSKYLLEQALRSLSRHSGLSVISLRYFNAAGASEERGEDHRPESHLIPRILRVASGREPAIEIFGDDYETPDGTCVRDYVHVLDLAEAHMQAMTADCDGFTCFNLGSGSGFSVREVVDTARRVTGQEIPARISARRSGDPPVLVASSARAQTQLGQWMPVRSDLASILSSAWVWMQTHPDGYA